MARRKSPYGDWKRIQLKYREHDPRYAGLDDLIQRLPAGDKHASLLDILFAGLAAKGIPVRSPNPVPLTPIVQANPDKSEAEYSRGAVSILTQSWE